MRCGEVGERTNDKVSTGKTVSATMAVTVEGNRDVGEKSEGEEKSDEK